MQLFKYCNENGVIILESMSIKFLDVTKSNDPFDCSPIINASPATRLAMRLKLNRIRNASEFENFADMEARRRGFSDQWIKKERKRSHERTTQGTKFQQFFKVKPDQFFMLSLAKNGLNPLMWSHYSNEHRGLLIEFETEGLFSLSSSKTLWNLELNKVKYSKTRPILSPVVTNSPAVYLTKDDFWSYEEEWRVFALPRNLTHDTLHNLYTYPLQPSVIKSVILGCRAEESLIQRVKNALSATNLSHVQLKRSTLDGIKFKFNYELMH